MNNEHTPGPWWVDQGSLVFATELLETVDEDTVSEAVEVADCSAYWGEYDIRANARLIASAPALLDMLEKIVAKIDDENRKDDVLRRRTYSVLEEAKAVLWEACGE